MVYTNKCKNFFFEYLTGECAYTELLLDEKNKVLYCGTERGSIRVHLWPPVFTEKSQRAFKKIQQVTYIESYEFFAHLYPIDHLRLTPNSDSLISISSDGLIFVLNLERLEEMTEEQTEGIMNPEDSKEIRDTINDLFFIKGTSLKNQQRIIKTMQLEVARYQKKMKTDEENRHKERKGKIQNIEKAFKQSMKDNENLKQNFFENSDKKLKKKQEEIERLENEIREEEERLTRHTTKMVNYERKRNANLRGDFSKLKETKEKKINEIVLEQKTILKELKNEYKTKLSELERKCEQIESNAKIYGENFLNKIELEEGEHDKEISMKSRKFERMIKREREGNKKLQISGDELAIKNTKSNNIDNEKQARFEQLVIENTELLEKKVKICISLLKKQEQLLEREQVVFSKDETIKQARDEQINLENFRFMLDQKIKSLTANKETLVEEIDAREKILRDMFNELIRQSQINGKTYLDIKELLKKLDILQEQKKNVELKIYYWNSKMKEYHRQLTSMLSAGSSKIKIASKVKEILEESKNSDITKELRQFSKEDVMNKIVKMGGEVSTNVHEELLNQNKWLLKKLHMINIASKQIRMIRDENIEMGLNQNKKLIEECNKLKIDNEFLVQQYNNYKKIIDEARENNEDFLREKMKVRNKGALARNENNLFRKIAKKNPNRSRVSSKSNSSLRRSKASGYKLPRLRKSRNGGLSSSKKI